MRMMASNAPPSPPDIMYFNDPPAIKYKMKAIRPIIMAVPKSGCNIINPKTTEVMKINGANLWCLDNHEER